MVKLLDMEISVARLTLRLIIALLLAAFSLTALYFVPRILIDYASSAITEAQLMSLINQLFDSRALTLGILTSVIVLLTITLRKTKLEGPLLICLGALLITYSYILLQGGTMNLQIPATEIQESLGINIPMSVQAHLSLNISTLMLVSLCPPILIIIKGAILTFSRLRKGVEST